MSGIKRLIQEAHRRSVWQVLGIYIVVSWVALQVVDLLAENFGLPSWFPALALGLLVVGVPIVVATAFVQEGVRPRAPGAPFSDAGSQASLGSDTPGVERTPSSNLFTWRNAILGGVGAFALWGLVAAVWMIRAGGATAGGPASGAREGETLPSVAVLPFENLSPDEENRYFADGMHEEILAQLSQIGSMTVVSRTSVMEYRDTQKNARSIASELGVDHLLEGSVRKAGDEVRITVQLIEAESDRHLWSDNYERRLEDVFAIQAEVATRIAAALDAQLTSAELSRIETEPTESQEAYDYYLRGLSYRARGLTLRRVEDFELAAQMFEAATESDPDYVEALAAQAEVYNHLFSEFGHVDAGPRAKAAVERAAELAPDQPATQRALGHFNRWVTREYEIAERHLAAGRQAHPHDVGLLATIADLQLRRGAYEAAAATYREILDLDPSHEVALWSLGRTYYVMRRYEEAEDQFDRHIARYPDGHWGHFFKMLLYLTWDGNAERARHALEAALERTDLFRFLLVSWDFDDAMVLRIFAERLDEELFRRTLVRAPDDSAASYLAKAEASNRSGRIDSARAYYDSARAVLEERLGARPDEGRDQGRLGLAYAGLGRAVEARQAGERAVELYAELPGFAASYVIPTLARIHVQIGDYDAAIDRLDQLLAVPSIISVPLLKFDPVWDPLREHPRFQALLAKYE